MLNVIELVYHLSLLVALSVVSGFIGQRWQSARLGATLQGVLFGSTAVIGMMHPLVLSEGVIFDGRSVMISLCGFFFGPVSVAVAGTMAAICRIAIGGAGMNMGLLVILSSAIIGLAFHARRRDVAEVTARELFLFGLLVHIAMLSMVWALPRNQILSVLHNIGLPVLATYPLATVLVGKILSDHKARMRYVQSLWDSKEQFRSTLYSIGDGVITTDVMGRIVHMNPVAQSLTAWTEQEAQGRPLPEVFQIVHRATGAAVGNPAERVLRAGKAVGFADTVLTARDGTTRFVTDSGSPIRDAQGRVTGVVLVFRDQSVELAAASAQRESERLARSTVDALSAQIAILDESGEILTVNRAWGEFGEQNGLGESAMLNANYIAVCESARGRGSEGGAEFGAGIRAVIDGSLEEFGLEYACETAAGERWFIGRVTRFSGEGPTRLVVAHEEITQRKQAEARLLEQREELRRANQILTSHLENSPLAVIEWDREYRVTWWSGRAEEIFGWREDEVLHKHPEEWHFIHEDDLPAVRLAIADAQQGIRRSFETNRNYTRDGKILCCEWYTSCFADDDGNVVSIFSLVHDVTPRTMAEQALQASEKQYRNLVELTHDVVWAVDIDGRLSYVSPAAWRVLGRDPESMVGRLFQEFVPDEGLERSRTALSSALAQGESSYTFEYNAYHTDGTEMTLIANATFVRDEAGKLVGVVGTSQDVTARKAAEEAMRESEYRYRSLFQNAPVGIFTTRSSGEVESINPAMARMLGWPSPEDILLKERDVEADLYVDPKRREEFLRLLAESGHVSDFEYQGRRSEDRIIWLSMNARISNRFPDGTFQIEGFTTDVTKRKEAEEQLRQAQKMEAVGRLAGGVAHDFNNMLGVILGHAEMALEGMDANSSLQADLDQIVKAARRSAELTRQLLAFARKQTIAPKVLDLNETIEKMLKMLVRLLGEDIELVWKPGPDLGSVCVDPTQIDQILANLTVNARHAISGVGMIAIETGNVEIDRFYCRSHPEATAGRYVLLTVSDNGCGMSQSTVDRLFEPFFTTKRIGEGTGLGLATVYGIVKQNGGFINVYSELWKGSTFNIYLPRQEAALPEPEAEIEPAIRFYGKSGSETILVVEDEPALLTLAELSLKRLGYTVLTSGSPTQAIEIARDYPHPIDVLVTDVVMPGMSGCDVFRKLSDTRPGLKCMFMSGYTADAIAHSGVLDEGVHFLQKPFTVQALADKVREVLES